MQLSDFFAPFSFYNLGILFLCLVVFDAIGVLLADALSTPKFLRPVVWVFGLALFVFAWFVIHLWLPFTPTNVVVSLIIAAVIALPRYFWKMSYGSLVSEVIRFPWPLVFTALVAKPLFFLTSLPPYLWDEMAYHLGSPAQLFSEKAWLFTQPVTCKCWGLYEMLPKFLETSFTLMFSATQTYATARLLHLILFISALYAVGLFLKQQINVWAAIIYTFLALYLNHSILTSSTLGYVDAAAASIANVFLVSTIGFIIYRTREYFVASALLLGITISIKYSTLGFVAAVVLMSVTLLLAEHIPTVWRWIRHRYPLNLKPLVKPNH